MLYVPEFPPHHFISFPYTTFATFSSPLSRRGFGFHGSGKFFAILVYNLIRHDLSTWLWHSFNSLLPPPNSFLTPPDLAIPPLPPTSSSPERSRQSARECRARKKLRYQYLEDLTANAEESVLALRKEMEQVSGYWLSC